jgi:hypothetical protein
MLRKALLIAAVTAKVAVLALVGHWSGVATETQDPTLKADCPSCYPPPSCYPGDPCADCD